MSNIVSSPACFLNLDLELESSASLAPLARHFGARVMVLHCGPGANGEHLAVEPVIGGQLNPDPAACTEHMLGLLEGLPEEPRRLWQSCTSRVFDYGFDGGLEENPMSASLSPAQLRRVADLGLELRMTVYPYRSHDPSQGE